MTEPVFGAAGRGSVRRHRWPALAESGVGHQTEIVSILVQVALRSDHHIDRGTQADQVPIDRLCRLSSVRAIGDDHQDINIAVRSHIAAGSRAEQNNPPRVDNLDDPSHQVIDDFRVRMHA